MTSDFCLCYRQKEYGKAKGNVSSAAFKECLHPVLHLHLIGQKWVTWLSLAQSLEGGWEKEVRRGLDQPASSVCSRWVFVSEHIALRPWTQEPAN